MKKQESQNGFMHGIKTYESNFYKRFNISLGE